jgi:hypothetical protein
MYISVSVHNFWCILIRMDHMHTLITEKCLHFLPTPRYKIITPLGAPWQQWCANNTGLRNRVLMTHVTVHQKTNFLFPEFDIIINDERTPKYNPNSSVFYKVKTFQKSRRHHLNGTQSKFYTEYPWILGTTIQDLLTWDLCSPVIRLLFFFTLTWNKQHTNDIQTLKRGEKTKTPIYYKPEVTITKQYDEGNHTIKQYILPASKQHTYNLHSEVHMLSPYSH